MSRRRMMMAKKPRGGVTLITFYVNYRQIYEYQAEDGMTWGEWANSDYAPSNAIVQGKYIFIDNHYIKLTTSADTTVIIAGSTYEAKMGSGAN